MIGYTYPFEYFFEKPLQDEKASPKYQKLELSDLISNLSSLKGKKIEVSAIVKGFQEKSIFFGARAEYIAFLEDKGKSILIQGDCGGIGPLKEANMLRESSELEKPISIQGKIKGTSKKSGEWTYKLKVSGVKLEDYQSTLYKKD